MRTRLIRLWSTGERGHAAGIRALLAIACLAPALGLHAAGGGEPANGLVRLESIAGQLGANTAAVLIQTSEPVPYVTSDPDPFTVYVDLRNASGAGVSNRFAPRPSGLVSAVTVEDSTAVDGAPVARVRVSLAGPFAHRVRSTRNVIRVEVDGQATAAPPSAVTSLAPGAGDSPEAASEPGAARRDLSKPATRLRSLRALAGPSGPMVELQGNGALTPSSIELTKESPYRLVLDFPGISPAVKPTTPVGSGPVDRVRVALHSSQPLVTRVVVDLTHPVAYRVTETGANKLTIEFREPAERSPDAATPGDLPPGPRS